MLIKIRQNLKCQRGFTLIELLAVITIIGILAAIAIPRFADSTAVANTAKTAADLRTIDSAIMMYGAGNGGTLPAAGTAVSTLAPNYLAAAPAPIGNNAKLYVTGTLTTLSSAPAYEIATVGSTVRAVINGGGLTNVVAESVHK